MRNGEPYKDNEGGVMGWLLAKEEVVAYSTRDSEYCQLAVDVGLWARKEQTRKLVEWLDEVMLTNSRIDFEDGEVTGEDKIILHEDWQALKKEAGCLT